MDNFFSISYKQIQILSLTKFFMHTTFLTAGFACTSDFGPGTNAIQYNECVIVLHGLARTRRSMTRMANALSAGGYRVININYPSRKYNIETLADRYVDAAVQACRNQRPTKIHFVGHSLGGILVRCYLARHHLPELGHVVMLSPPNQGTEVVDSLSHTPGFHALCGPAGLELGTSADSTPNRLGPVDYSVGVIAGNRNLNPFLSKFITGENDGTVSVARTRVEGMRDMLVVPHTHPLIMRNKEVIRQTVYFLQHGEFDRK